MKAMKKISTLFLALCLMVSCMSLTVFAADGRISFSDPSTAVGDDVEITCAVRSEGNTMSTVEVDIDFDTEYLKFKSGEGATEGETGALILSSDPGSTEAVFTLTFQALKECDTKVTIESYRITGESGDSMDFTMGNSSVSIAEGDSSKIDNSETSGTASGSTSTNTKTATIEVNGVQYTLTGDFPDATIPSGYVRADISLGGEELPMLKSESSGAVLAYLVDSSGTGDFFYYDQETDSMWPYAEVEISDSTTLLLLSDTSNISLPEVYKQATLTIDNKDFPTWQDTSNDQGYYIIYGLASDGNKGYYRYDSKQGTYQRFDVSAEEDTEEAAVPAGILGQIEQFIQDHMLLCIIAAAAILVILLILLLVLAVKLHNRNRELDELYDEYGIDEEDEPEPEPTPSKKEQKKAQKQAKKAKQEEEFEEDYEEDLYGDGEDFDEDEYTEEILSEDDLEDEDFFDEEYDSDEDPLDLSQNLSEATGKLTIVEDEEEDDFEDDDEEPVDDKTRVITSQEEEKVARKRAAAKTGRSTQAKSSQAKSSQAKSTQTKSSQAKAGKVRRTRTDEEEEPAAKPARKTTAKKTATKKAASRNVDEDLENVPEDEDIFAGYDKREELTLDDLYGEEKKKKKKGHQEDDDSFKVDFIDLD